MARYIDADEAYEIGKNEHKDFAMSMGDLTSLREVLDDTPTADVVEVRHGRWIEDGYYEKPCVCSCCGEEAKYISSFEETFDYDWEENLRPTGYEGIREYIRTPYCPNCGAKMDGKDEKNAEK